MHLTVCVKVSGTLIIAEKADAGRRIAYFLSAGKAKQKKGPGSSYFEFEDGEEKFFLVSLSGHIVEIDFPAGMKSWQSTDLEALVDSSIVKNVKNRRAYTTLKDLSKGIDRFIIATDYDREGELIGVEALDLVGATNEQHKIIRAKFSALTREEIVSSFQNPISVDYRLADSAFAREIIDLIWGAVLTRFFSISSHRLGKDFISAGRVQTPTLALVVDRENEIRAFRPETFFRISVVFNKGRNFQGIYEGGDIFSEEEARSVFAAITGDTGKVLNFSSVEEKILKPPPFNTTEFLREASRIGVNPSRAMKIAETLYTRGIISYPRTDNTVYQKSINLKSILNRLKESEFQDDVLKVLSQERLVPSRGRTKTTDHPPIHPVSVPKTRLTGDYKKLYDLVVRRFLATLFRNGKRIKRTSRIKVGGVVFNTEGFEIIDPGWLELYPYRKVKEIYHPDLEEGESLKVVDKKMDRDETKPPPRYNLASLLKLMESLNLGTKSTRHDIIEKLQLRGFIEGNPVKPTPLGMGFIKAVRLVDSRISEPDMTARLEQDMEKITSGTLSRDDVIGESRTMLKSVLTALQSRKEDVAHHIKEALSQGEVIGKCPEHGTDISLIKDRFSSRIKCSTDGCRIDFVLRDRGKIELTDQRCPTCGLPIIKIIRRGQSPQRKCLDPKCPYNAERAGLGKCPDDAGELIIRQSKNGKRFLGCSNYPSCKRTYPLPQMGTLIRTEEVCPVCGAPLIVLKKRGYSWKFCPDMNCKFNSRQKKGSTADEKDPS